MAHYVTIEQAKWLKEKGFNELSKTYFGFDCTEEEYVLIEDYSKHYYNSQNDDEGFIAPISAPEHSQVIDWLKSNCDIDITHTWSNLEGQKITAYSFEINYPKKDFVKDVSNKWEEYELYLDWSKHNGKYRFNSQVDAYSAAFDYIKNNNICIDL